MKPHPKTGYEIWHISRHGALIEYMEGAVMGTWTKKTAVREFKAKYAGTPSTSYAVVKVQRRVVLR